MHVLGTHRDALKQRQDGAQHLLFQVIRALLDDSLLCQNTRLDVEQDRNDARMCRHLLPRPRLDQDCHVKDRKICPIDVDTVFLPLLLTDRRAGRFERDRKIIQQLNEHIGRQIELLEDGRTGERLIGRDIMQRLQ